MRRLAATAALVLSATSTSQPQAPRNLLAGRMSEAQLAAALVPIGQWHPYPTIDERERWTAVPAAIRAAYVSQAERYLHTDWGSIPATVTLRFVRDGNRRQYDSLNTLRREKLSTLVAAEVLENRGRFLDDIANGIWALCEQTFWGSTAHLGAQKRGVGLPDVTEPVVELFSAETASLLAWTDYLLGKRLDTVSPLLRERIRLEVDRRILTPALERDEWQWSGLGTRKNVNNWNPWINSNWLTSALILEKDPQRRARMVYKIMRSLDVFINGYPDDGGCDEGPGYWDRAGASLFDNLELLKGATNGAIDIYAHPLIGNMGRYIYRVYIKDPYFVNNGDAPAKANPDPELVYAYGQRIKDPVMSGFGAFLAHRRGSYTPGSSTLGRILPALLNANELASARAAEPLLADAWLPDLQLMAARSAENSSSGLFLASFGGHNGQSHNHNDVGNFVVFADGTPLLIDVGVELYSAKTFSSKRYEIWTMQSAFHNLPTINGAMEQEGREFEARDVHYTADRWRAQLTMDLAHAYPPEAQVDRYRRTVALDRRARRVELSESYALRAWKEPIRLNLMTPLIVDVTHPGEVRLKASSTSDRGYVIRYPHNAFEATTEEIPITDGRLLPIWGPRLARIVLIAKGKALQGEHHISVGYAE